MQTKTYFHNHLILLIFLKLDVIDQNVLVVKGVKNNF